MLATIPSIDSFVAIKYLTESNFFGKSRFRIPPLLVGTDCRVFRHETL